MDAKDIWSEKTHCDRCSQQIDKREWPDDWPNEGSILLRYASQILSKLTGNHNSSDSVDAAIGEEGHPALTDLHGQKVEFEWGMGSKTGYRLCQSCQARLIGLVGNFFGFHVRRDAKLRVINEREKRTGAANF